MSVKARGDQMKNPHDASKTTGILNENPKVIFISNNLQQTGNLLLFTELPRSQFYFNFVDDNPTPLPTVGSAASLAHQGLAQCPDCKQNDCSVNKIIISCMCFHGSIVESHSSKRYIRREISPYKTPKI